MKAYKNNDQYDIFHTNDPTSSIFYSFFSKKTPTVSVVHSPWDKKSYPIKVLEELFKQNENHWLIAISKYQKQLIQKNIKNVKLVYHGIDISKIEVRYESDFSYLSFLGRANKIKGIDIALDVAIKLGKSIKLAGSISLSNKKVFFQNKIKPKLENNKINKYLGPILDVEKKFDFLSKSRSLLFPIQWEEPFGLVMIEAMATGTPVVAFARGSVPEVIKDGETGFIVNPSDDDIRGNFIIKKTGVEGLCEAVERIYSMPEDQYRKMRKACREHVEKNFTVERMVDDYEKVYEEILNKKTS
jgi:glycosyltransferase involved in cell wall biosynthesis